MQKKNLFLTAIGFLAIFFVGWRFYSLTNAPYVYDEPIHQFIISKHFAEKTFPLLGTLGSSIPIQYGAGHLWFYSIPRFFSDEVMGFVLFHTLIFSTGFLFLYLGLRQWQAETTARLAVLIAAVSPYFLFLSRHPWDTTIFFPASGALFYIFSRLNQPFLTSAQKIRFVALLTLLVAYCANLHLACGPMLVAAGFTYLVFVLRSEWKWSQRLLWLGLSGLAVVILVTPYAIEFFKSLENVGKIHTNAEGNSRWGDGRHFWWNLQGIFALISHWKVLHYLEPMHEDFLSFIPGPKAIFARDYFSWLVKVFALIFALLPLKNIWRRVPGKQLPLPYIFICSSLVIFLFVQQFLNIPTAPHYFISIWFVAVVGAAASWSVEGIWRWPLRASLLLLMITNMIFCTGALLYLQKNHGTRGLNIGTGAWWQREAAAEVCIQMRARGQAQAILDTSLVFATPVATDYFFRHLPICQGLQISVQKKAEGAGYRYEYPAASASDAFILVKAL